MAWIIRVTDNKTSRSKVGVLGAMGPTIDIRLAMLFDERIDAEAMVERLWYERKRYPSWTPEITEAKAGTVNR